MAKLNILLLDNSHLPSIGGKEIVVHHLAKQFLSLGHQVTVAGPGGYLKNRNLDLGYPVQRFPSLPWGDVDTRWKIQTQLIFRRGTYDIANSHTTHPSGYHAQRWLSRHNAKTPLVVTPHGGDIHKVPEQNWGKRLDPEVDQKVRWLLQNCAAATAISDSVRDSLIEAGAPLEKIHNISNGVDTERMQKQTDIDVRQQLGLPANCPIAVTVGNFKPIKGHDVIVDALSECKSKELRLVIVGQTSEEFVTKTADGPVGDRVIFTGPLSFPMTNQKEAPDLLAALMQESIAYISGSIGEGTEGLSLALLESMAAGCCPVASSISGNRDLITHKSNGLLVEAGNSRAMADALNLIMAEPAMHKRMSEEAKATVEEMSWRRIANRYIDLYRTLIDNGGTDSQ